MKMFLLACTSIIVITVLMVFLYGCSEKVPTEIIDQNQIISQNNAEMNAKQYRTKRFPKTERVMVDSDSSINADCRYGDGWASGKLVLANGKHIPIKCQTNGRGKGFNGCMTKDEFLTKEYADEEGRCNKDLTELKKFK